MTETAPATTTSEQDRHTAGQRRINLAWEYTQSVIAQATVGTVLFVAAKIALIASRQDANDKQMAMAITAFVLLSNLASLIIGFYFGRTNHQRVGGVDIGR